MQLTQSIAYTRLPANSSTPEPVAQILPRMTVSGGLTAPDPNRPFQSRPNPTPPQATSHASRTQLGASEQSGNVCQPLSVAIRQADQQGSKAAATGTQAGMAQAGGGSRAPATGGSAGVSLAQRGGQATPQDRVLAKLGLIKGGQASKGGQQAGKAAAAPCGESLHHDCGHSRSHHHLELTPCAPFSLSRIIWGF